MIHVFDDPDLERFVRTGQWSRRWDRRIERPLVRKIAMLDSAHNLQDLRSPPGNRLEQLSGALSGYFSIRVNDQWRLVFRWDRGVHDLKLVDYH